MKRNGALIGLCAICVPMVCLFAAQSAAAAGTFGRTCITVTPKVGETVGYEKPRCVGIPTNKGEKVVSEWGKPWAAPLSTRMVLGGGASKLKSTFSGIVVEVEAKETAGSGTIANEEVGGEAIARGTTTIAYKGATVAAPAGKGCEIAGGEITTKELKFTTAGQGMFLKFEPASGTVFATFKIQGCSLTGLNKEYKVEGTVKGVPNENGEVVFTHVETTEQGTLKFGAQPAGLAGAATLEAREMETEEFKVVGFTT
jgi:hypothetical protein